jgi:hypothetical protein
MRQPQQDQILQVGAAALDPGDQVMGFQVPGLVAARVLAQAVVPDHQGPAVALR